MLIVTDQLGRRIQLMDVPKRIVSVVPSQTEFLYEIGLGDSIVGQTIFCVHPVDKFKKATKIGGTKKLNISRIKALKPDIIIANKEENEQSQIEELEKDFPVWISDIKTLDSALEMMNNLGDLFQKNAETQALTAEISNRFLTLKSYQPKQKKRALYIIWQKPWMAAGRDTFINEMLEYAGFENVIQEPDSRYPNLFIKDFEDYKPDYVFLSSEPFPFTEAHVAEMQSLLPKSVVKLVDGEMFSWYGSRLNEAAHYFEKLI